MELSIIIVNWNTKYYLKDCLASIYENIKGVSYEVIVVDNNSSDGSVELVKKLFPHVKLIASNVNTGFAKGNNIGYRISDGEYVAYLNPDTIIYPCTFEKAISYLRTHPKVGAVSCKFLNPDGSFQREFYRRFPNLSTVFFYFTLFGVFIDKTFLKRKYANNYFYRDKNFDKIEIIDQPGAAFIIIPRQILEKIGVFDEDFPLFFNDVDLCKRVWGAGLEIHLLNDIAIIHHGGKGIGQLFWPSATKHFILGCYHYFRKHHGVFLALLIIVFLLLNLLEVFCFQVVRYLFKYIFTIKKYGILKANEKAFEFIKTFFGKELI